MGSEENVIIYECCALSGNSNGNVHVMLTNMTLFLRHRESHIFGALNT